MQFRSKLAGVPVTLPGPTVGVVGGGQLGRMLAEAAAPLGVETVVLDPTPDPPAAPVARASVTAAFDDAAAVRDLAERVDVLTYEIELADPDLLAEASEATGTPVHPDPETLRVTGDKLAEKRALADAGVPVPTFRRVDDAGDLAAAVDDLGPVMLKARHGGYDGRGNRPVGPDDDPAAALREVGAGDGGALAEALVDFERELSVVGVVGDGERATFPLVETIHEAEILRATTAPARASEALRERADAVARDVLDVLDGRGVLAVELFETSAGDVLVNEVAPRPHNSGHWTIEGAHVSQFAAHVRAVLGWPVGPTGARCETATVNVLADVPEARPARLSGVEPALEAGAHLHWYGKREARPLRKMGHLTVTADRLGGDDDGPLATARRVRDALRFDGPDDEPGAVGGDGAGGTGEPDASGAPGAVDGGDAA
jgi:5-(carboxyamino)imidazole ribonucleotide synthase